MTYPTCDPILETHAFAAVQIDAGSNILSGNSKSRQLWQRRSDLFCAENARFAILDHGAQKQFGQRLSAATSTASQFAIGVPDPRIEAMHWLVVHRLGPAASTASASAPSSAPETSGADRRFLVSFRLANDFSQLINPEHLTEDLGLTPTEARIVAALAEGYSVREYAAREGGSTTTTRWHLDNARKKLGCASQRDLVRTVLLVCV